MRCGEQGRRLEELLLFISCLVHYNLVKLDLNDKDNAGCFMLIGFGSRGAGLVKLVRPDFRLLHHYFH